MRNFAHLKWIIIISMIMFSTVFAQNPIPNPGFEEWELSGGPSSPMQPVGWGTNNLQGGIPFLVSESSDAHGGSSSSQLIFNEIQGAQMFTAFAVSERYENLNGFYKFSTSSSHNITFSITMLNSNSVIASVNEDIITSAGSWTAFSIPITYEGSGTPDSCQLIISLGGFPAEGTTAHLDDLVFGGSNASGVVVVAPNGGEDWPFASEQTITWTSDNVTNVQIEYSTDGGGNWQDIVASTPAGMGSYPWVVPNIAFESTACQVRISDASNSEINDKSDADFTISKPENAVLTLTSPNGGENWQTGSEQVITWEEYLVNNVKIELSTDNGSKWTTVIESTPGMSGFFSFFVPGSPSTECLIRISQAGNASVNDASNATFTISSVSTPAVNLTAPNGGENWEVGSQNVITWQSQEITNVKIEYSSNNGLNWNTVTSSMTAETGSYSWTVPNSPSTQCQVRISDASNAALNDVSEENFTISGIQDPTVIIASPNGGENWTVGTEQNISWVSQDITNVRIEFSTNNGDDWNNVIASIAASEGTYSWAIPNTPSDICLVRISDAGNSEIHDLSNSNFTISAAMAPTVIIQNPDGGEDWTVGNDHAINWVSQDISSVKIEYTTNDGASWVTIEESVSATEGVYVWMIPDTPSFECKVRISDVSNPETNDESDAWFTISSPVSGIEDIFASGMPEKYQLFQNYPNPFNPSTTIVFSLPKQSEVQLTIYNTNGQKVESMITGSLSAGFHKVNWDASNQPSGVYFYHLQAKNFNASKKMLLIK